MYLKKMLPLLAAVSPAVFYAQAVQDSLRSTEIETVVFVKKAPTSAQIINVKKDLQNINHGQDLPVLLNQQTALVSTSDAGNGIGYTGMRIRGVEGSRINVTLNNVPYNDSESQGTFFVDVPDLASSASQIVIHRGVGTSSNGVAAFGASVNILTADPAETPYFLTQHSQGSFNSRRNIFEVGTGSFADGKLSLMARYSLIASDGYLERASSDLKSYSITGLYKTDRTRIKLLAFGGKEKTYQAWYGIDPDTYAKNRRFNSSGAIYDADGNIINYYGNETDNYTQNHWHLYFEHKFGRHLRLNVTGHYTDGKGYYENYKQNTKLSNYGLEPILIGNTSIKRMDLIRRKWLDNDFYGGIAELAGQYDNLDFNMGIVANQYLGRHYGEVAAGNFTPNLLSPYEYYRNLSTKNEMAAYGKVIFKLGAVDLFGDIQFRNIHYYSTPIAGVPWEMTEFDKTYNFWNPKAGLSYNLEGGKLYFSYAQANREPKRSDLVDSNGLSRPEKLHDFELGYNTTLGPVRLEANGYYMLYHDQLVATGRLNDVGEMLQENVSDSYRRGIELALRWRATKYFGIDGNIAWSQNKIRNYQFYDIYTESVQNLGDTDIAFSPNLVSGFAVNFYPIEKLTLGLVNKYVGAQYLDNTQQAAVRLPDYFLSNIVAGYLVQMPHMDVNITLNVNNLFNRMYVSNGYSMRDPSSYPGPTPGLYPQAGINFMMGVSVLIK